jgi:hypothetical protein
LGIGEHRAPGVGQKQQAVVPDAGVIVVRGEERESGKDGRAGLGGVGRMVWRKGGGDGEVVAIYSN